MMLLSFSECQKIPYRHGKRTASILSSERMMRSLKELSFNVEKEYVFNKKQTLISDFFLKQ